MQVATRDCAQQRDGDLHSVSQSRLRSSLDWDPAAAIGIPCGAVSEGEELAQVATTGYDREPPDPRENRQFVALCS